MSTISGRTADALLVIDVQNAVVDGAHDRDGVVSRIASLVDSARAADTAVVWVQHSDDELAEGSDGWRIVNELLPAGDEQVVPKNFADSFEATKLESVLADAGVGRLVVVGAETDVCVRSTIHGAFTRGYDVTLVSDAHATGDKSAWGAPPAGDVIAHTNLYWQFQSAPGRTAAVVQAKDVAFG